LENGERFAILALLLASAGCQRTNPTEQRSAAKPLVEAPPSQPVTPQSIVKDMFPGAPEKTQSVACFRSLTPEMSIDMVVQRCGRPDEEIGSGLYVFVYHLRDGSSVTVSTPYLDRIYYVGYTDARGQDVILLKRQ
jgi:hypothetical protein